MAEGTKDASTDMQMAAGLKPGHKIMAVDPDTGLFVGLTPEQLGSGENGSSLTPIFTDDSLYI